MPKKLTLEQFVEKSQKMHGDRYDYSLVEYQSARKTVKIICNEHGVFEQVAFNHTKGCGCPKCGDVASNILNKKTLLEFINEALIIHKGVYDYSQIAEYINNQTKVNIICKKHGIFLQSPSKHLLGRGCPKCGKIEASKKYSISQLGRISTKRKTTEQFILESKNIHGNRYDYNKVEYITNRHPITITCKIHGDFIQNPQKHLMKRGCPQCQNTYSKIANEWLDYMNIFEREYRLPQNKTIPVDGYDILTNTCYQFHGDFWHGNPKIFNHDDINPKTKQTYGELYEKTVDREREIKNYGYNLIVMWEADWKEQRKSLLP